MHVSAGLLVVGYAWQSRQVRVNSSVVLRSDWLFAQAWLTTGRSLRWANALTVLILVTAPSRRVTGTGLLKTGVVQTGGRVGQIKHFKIVTHPGGGGGGGGTVAKCQIGHFELLTSTESATKEVLAWHQFQNLFRSLSAMNALSDVVRASTAPGERPKRSLVCVWPDLTRDAIVHSWTQTNLILHGSKSHSRYEVNGAIKKINSLKPSFSFHLF